MSKKEKENNGQESIESNNKENQAELINKIFESQDKEMAIRKQELALAEKEQEQSFKYATKALEFQAQDRIDERKIDKTKLNYGFYYALAILIFFGLFVFGCFYTDNVNLIVSIIKGLALIIPSSFGGYYFGFAKGKKTSQEEGYEILEE